ncbi:MAG: hypothetical protein CL522_02980 [Actinobacteria bacterium]|nr:hypothetical protein [Actinomycetota bacterium]
MRRLVLFFSATILFIGVASVNPAHAHDPLFLTAEQSTPERGPYLPDGTISFALYGEFTEAGGTRGFQAMFQEGDYFQLELLIPARAPEENLAEDQLPYLLVVKPDSTEEALYPSIRSRFDEPFTNTSYYTFIKEQGTSIEGVYDITVVARHAARFTVAIGFQEQFGTTVERAGDRSSAFGETRSRLEQWYNEPMTADSEEYSSDQEIDEQQSNQQTDTATQSTPTQSTHSVPKPNSDNTEEQVPDEESLQSKQPNRAIWIVVLIAVIMIPVGLVIRRIRKVNP